RSNSNWWTKTATWWTTAAITRLCATLPWRDNRSDFDRGTEEMPRRNSSLLLGRSCGVGIGRLLRRRFAPGLEFDQDHFHVVVGQVLRQMSDRRRPERLSRFHVSLFSLPVWIGKLDAAIGLEDRDQIRMAVHHRLFVRSVMRSDYPHA